jgi:hypothetical protein
VTNSKRGPVGGYFVWEQSLGGPLLLLAGGSGIVPLRAPLRHHRAIKSAVREQGVGADEDERAGEKADRRDPGTRLGIGLGRELERNRGHEDAAAERGDDRRDPLRRPAATTAPASSEPPTTSPQPIEAPRLLM